jgi:hypothetical protein
MKHVLQAVGAISLVIAGLQGAPVARADDSADDRHYSHQMPCQSSASSMFKACRFGIRDDFNELQASCDQVGDAGEREDCRAQAREEYIDGRQECFAQVQSRFEVCGMLAEYRYVDPITDPSITYIDPDDVPSMYPANPYVSVVAGRTLLLRAGEDFEERVVIHVTDEIREVQGVPCRIVWDVVLVAEEDDEGEIEFGPVELTQDWFAQTASGDVVYCGEAVQDFEDGIVVAIDGSFESGTNYANGGFLTKANPVPYDVHRQELAVGEAEDLVEYLDTAAIPSEEEGGENPAFPCAPGGCLRTFDFSTLDPSSTEYKYYLAGTGFVLAVSLDDGEINGEREELVCAGDSLEILSEPECGLGDDAEELLDTICKLVPDALCED